MAEKLIPDLQYFATEIVRESQLDLPTRRVKMAERLMNLPLEIMPEIHLEPWYSTFWKLVNLSMYTSDPPEYREQIAQKILAMVEQVSEPTRRQFFALALLMFGKGKEALALMDQKLWSLALREDFETFTRWNKLANIEPNLGTRASLVRNRQINNFLQEKYSELIKKYSTARTDNNNRADKFRIWYCWLQGEENLPPIVQCCYNSLKMNAGRYEICFIDENNFSDYVDIPEYILRKFKGGGISRTHFSDILRVNLLDKYGGLWLDSTILVTEPLERHKKLLERRYFTQKFHHDKDNFSPYAVTPSYGRWAGFVQGSILKHYPLFAFMKDFYAQYWADFDEIIDYVLMDFEIDFAYKNIAAVRADMDAVPINNPDTWTLLYHLNAPYLQFPYDRILAETFLHKLNWRVKLNTEAPDAVYREIQKRYLGE